MKLYTGPILTRIRSRGDLYQPRHQPVFKSTEEGASGELGLVADLNTPEAFQTFMQQSIQEGKPVVVDFWAPWCGPCQRMNPKIQTLAQQEHMGSDRFRLGKVNVDLNGETKEMYPITTLPTLFAFHHGKHQKLSVDSRTSVQEMEQHILAAIQALS